MLGDAGLSDCLPDGYTVKHILKPKMEEPTGRIRYRCWRWTAAKSKYQQMEKELWDQKIREERARERAGESFLNNGEELHYALHFTVDED